MTFFLGVFMMSAQTESIEISGLPPGTKVALEELSRSKGNSAEEYLRMLIEAEILSEKSFSEILAHSPKLSQQRNDGGAA